LSGAYLFQGDGLSGSTPLAFGGIERFDGQGHVAGTNSFSIGGAITRQATFSGVYAVAADCTGTLTIGNSLHFDIYASSTGDQFHYVQTDPGSVSATTEHRVSRNSSRQCRTATLSGTYLFNGDGFSISGSAQTAIADAGFDGLDGAGHDVGRITSSTGGVIDRADFTGTYTVAADCTGTLTVADNTLHFDIYVSPSGDRFVNVETDAGVVKSETEDRA
jgi:hypothetical protein